MCRQPACKEESSDSARFVDAAAGALKHDTLDIGLPVDEFVNRFSDADHELPVERQCSAVFVYADIPFCSANF